MAEANVDRVVLAGGGWFVRASSALVATNVGTMRGFAVPAESARLPPLQHGVCRIAFCRIPYCVFAAVLQQGASRIGNRLRNGRWCCVSYTNGRYCALLRMDWRCAA